MPGRPIGRVMKLAPPVGLWPAGIYRQGHKEPLLQALLLLLLLLLKGAIERTCFSLVCALSLRTPSRLGRFRSARSAARQQVNCKRQQATRSCWSGHLLPAGRCKFSWPKLLPTRC